MSPEAQLAITDPTVVFLLIAAAFVSGWLVREIARYRPSGYQPRSTSAHVRPSPPHGGTGAVLPLRGRPRR